ncbi:hypothetical protein JVT61DRAFT_14789 [Boletus reticuloceps]|uniref:Autophagy-related protein 101 n=1 Tax=Boletus reticuloceps TaxID=495285 RepID=A0A8I2YWR4_9AGAM|nr:hypothetical protein JVT61DRAFT_14789 [Boletus reticuloceps]
MATQPGVADPEMEQLVNEKVDVFWKGIESGSSKRGQVLHRLFSSTICSFIDQRDAPLPRTPFCARPCQAQILVTFSEKKPKKSWFQVYVGEEDVPWEQWSVAPFIPRSILTQRSFPSRYPTGSSTRNLDNQKQIEVHLHVFIPYRHEFSASLATTLTKALHVMLTHTSSEEGRTAVPLITNATGISPFPIRITVKVDGIEIG